MSVSMAIAMPSTACPNPTPPSSVTNVSAEAIGTRRDLPDKEVTSATIEGAYIRFILYCNPAVPPETDTSALGEAFRIPPKSDGQTFSTFTLFTLIQQLHTQELKTWAGLAKKLGVTDPEAGQSSQKIQQYAVRLKRWMHSMHIDSFFDYLQGNEHPYWTQIPTDPNPVCEEGRDGVAGEDDMALRSLLPQIKPPRGRRKPEGDLNRSPSQKPRLVSPNNIGDMAASQATMTVPWTAQPDGQRAFLFPPTDEARSSILPGSGSGFPWPSELSQTSMTAYPQSAMTPINGRGFWADEPRSAITLSKAKLLGRRHGAKAVSSAWRSGGSGGTGKTRGRPPNSRSADTPISAAPDFGRGFQNTIPDKNAPKSAYPMSATIPVFPEDSTPTTIQTPTSAGPNQSARTGRPGRLSLQVPERQGGNVRLATPPPPIVMVNGQNAQVGTCTNDSSTSESGSISANQAIAANTEVERSRSITPAAAGNGIHSKSAGLSPEDNDTTNVREVENLLISALLTADWFDGGGNQIPPCDYDEVEATARTIISNMQKQSLTPDTFLLNLAALAGGSVLQRGIKAKVTRTTNGLDSNKYTCQWGLRYGSLKGAYSLTETIHHNSWKKNGQDAMTADPAPHQIEAAAHHWKKKYEDLLRTVGNSH